MKKKLFCIIMITMLMISIIAISTYALSFTATMTPSATTVAESTEFTVKVRVSNLDVGTNGINLLSGYLKYDTDVFEEISQSSIEGLNSWSPKYDATTGKIELTKSSFVTSAQEVFQVTFKTKSDINGKSGTIEFNTIVASNSEENISATNISTSITVGSTNAENTTNTTTDPVVITSNTSNATNNATTNNTANITSVNSNNTTNNSANVVSSYVNTMTNTTAEENMPNTGVNDTILKIIFIVIAIAIVFYIKIEKLNKDLY